VVLYVKHNVNPLKIKEFKTKTKFLVLVTENENIV